jgi:hypothetical protein
MDIVLIERNTPEWEYMWQWLESHPINENIEDPRQAVNNNEAWQYMGSARQDNKVIHSFRHRQHPRDNGRKDLSCYASDKFNDQEINKVIKVK